MKLCLVCNFQFEDEQDLCPKDYSKLVPLGKDQLIGKLIQDRYRVESMIAKGSMGIVYKATQELIGREVAIKVLHGYLVADEESIKRFHKEAKAASRLNHPNITTLYDYGVLGSGQPYIVMDLLRGSSLADILKQRDYLPLDEAMVIFKQVCDALGEAHKRGVVHRDIKPENIMLEYSDKGVHVKVVDFGIAKFLQEQEDTIGKITKTGTVCGSPTYMSPEQCDDNQVDARSDLYSLGVVLYETITGKVPFAAADIYQVMTMHVKDRPPGLKQVRPDIDFPAYLEEVMAKVLAKHPDARYQTAEQVWDALQGKGPTPQREAASTSSAPPVVREAGGSRSSTGTITEEEVKSVVAKALQKKLSMTGEIPKRPPDGNESPLYIDPALLKQPTDAASIQMQARRTHQGIDRKRIRHSTVSPTMRAFGFFQQIMPLVLTVALFGVLFWVVGNEARLHNVFKEQKAGTKTALGPSADVDDLIAQNKWDQAKSVLEKRRKEGTLAQADQDTLNSVYERLAKKEGKAKHYKAAVALIEQMSEEGKDDEEVRALLKKYKKSAGIR